jgi:hypothetical protein
MQTANDCGVYETENQEELARQGRAYAAVKICQCEDGLYRYGLDLMYSYGGFAYPISDRQNSFASYRAAKEAAIQKLLQRFPKPWPSDPQSVHDELRSMKAQIEQNFRQPSLF